MYRDRAWRIAARCALGVLLAMACDCASVKRIAINKLGDSLADSGTTYTADDDPDLVGAALPFSLKLVEGLLAQTPRHRGLLFAAASGFTEYAYAFVQQEADAAEAENVDRATELRARARRLYIRGRDYGLRGLEARHRGFTLALSANPRTAVQQVTKADVAMVYWTAASWGSAIAVSKDHPDLIADQPIVEALIDRAFVLDPDFDFGAIHGFLINYEMARQGGKGDPAARARAHFDREVELTKGQLASPFVALAESVSIPADNGAEFESLLQRALAIDVNVRPEWRLQNLIVQKRARWLLSRKDDLFVQ